MAQIVYDLEKAYKKWTPLLENMGVKDETRHEWMSEMAEIQHIKENAYANLGNFQGMGAVRNPVVAAVPGNALGISDFGANAGSGDYGQQLLPVSMKIAAQTIGLDLVSVKPSPGPKIDLMFVDFAYDDNLNTNNERPQTFKIDFGADTATVNGFLGDVITATQTVKRVGGLSKRVYLRLATYGGAGYNPLTAPTGTKQGWVEFLGFSRIDLKPMFRIFRQGNVATASASTGWGFNAAENTFNADINLTTAFGAGFESTATVTAYTPSVSTPAMELISALEDHLPHFVANFVSDSAPMNRLEEETIYPGIIAPRVQSKTIQTGTIEISTALKRTEIEDIKANLGIDIVQKMESILVNELSQTISKQIVQKLYEMGDLNRLSAPTAITPNITGGTVFDFDVTGYLAAASAPGGETSHAVQRKLVTKILHASNYIATEGRVGPAQFVVTNGKLAAALADITGYTLNPVKSKVNGPGQLYPMGTIGDVQIYVDPYQRYDDNRMLVGRKNAPDMPGIVFIPYLMAQSISLLSEATFAPRMLLRSRYAIGELGWYPQKQYMTVNVFDANNVLA